MSRRGLGIAISALAAMAAGLVPLLLFAPLSRKGMESARRPQETSWPYCSPDATPPPMPKTPWPPLPPEGIDYPDGLYVLVDAIVLASKVTPDGKPDGSVQAAKVVVDEVLWETRFPTNKAQDLMLPPPEGSHIMTGEARGWAQAADALASGSAVALGLVAIPPEKTGFWQHGGYDADFIAETREGSVRFLGKPPFAQRETAMLEAFLSWEGNPLAGSDALGFLGEWNAEADAPPETFARKGAIARSWDRFWERFTGPELPAPGTLERWNAAPPQCRVLEVDSAPPKVLEGLVEVFVWVKVPPQWLELPDRCLRFRISIASLGCLNLDVVEGWSYAPFDEMYAVPGEPIELSIPGRVNGHLSWLKEVVIGRIPFEAIAPTRIVLVELDPTWIPRTYEELQADPPTSELVTARSLTLAEHQQLQQQWPAPPGEPSEMDAVP
jgi:hypothetical protein